MWGSAKRSPTAGHPCESRAADEPCTADGGNGREGRVHEGAAERSDDRIVGFTMFGSDAGEVLAAVQTAMLAKLPYPVLRDAVITHLTVAEGLGPLLEGVPPRDAASLDP